MSSGEAQETRYRECVLRAHERLTGPDQIPVLLYEPKPGHELDDDALTDPLEFLARVLIHVPEPNKHLVHL